MRFKKTKVFKLEETHKKLFLSMFIDVNVQSNIFYAIIFWVYEKMSNTKMSNCSTFFPFFVIEEKMSNRNFEKSTFFPFCSTFFPFLAIKLKCRIEILHKSTFFPFVRHFFLLVQHFFLFFVIKEKMSNDMKWLQRVALQQKHSTFFPFKFWVRHFFFFKIWVRHFFPFKI